MSFTDTIYFQKHREHPLHGDMLDAKAFVEIVKLRDEYRAKLEAKLHTLTPKGATILQDYLDGENDAEDDACVTFWRDGCVYQYGGEPK